MKGNFLGLSYILYFAVIAISEISYATETTETTDRQMTPDPLCPYPSDVITYFPYPGDCNKYWECFDGIKTEMVCPDDLYWNQETSLCDYPENVDCDSTSPTDETTTDGGWTPDPVCPFPSNESTYFPDPVDCRKYYECYGGAKTEMSCPDGLYWNQDISECDYPENVNCDSSIPTDETTTSGGWTPDPLCPYPSNETIYFPYPGDCSKYWECFDGIKTEMTCPEGLYWDEVHNICDYPENVNCDSTGTPTRGSTSSSDLPTGDTTTNGGWTPDPLCPYPSDEIIYFPYPGDCNKYWECFGGIKTEMTCPPDLYWNEELSYCDYPENVDCDTTGSPVTTTWRSTESSISPTEGTSETSTDGEWTPDPLCPYPSEEITYFPFPGDCNKYIECYAGGKSEMICPPDLYWNQELSYCDYPENVDCED